MVVGQSGCLILLVLSTALGIIGWVEYSKFEDHKAAFISWVWGGLLAIPWLVCSLRNSHIEFLGVAGTAFALWLVLWWQRRRKPS